MSVKNGLVKKIKHQFAHFFHPRKSNNHRAKLLHSEVLVFISLFIIGVSLLLRSYFLSNLLKSNVLGFASDITAEQVIVQTNQKRSELGLSELSFNQELSQAALSKGQDMFDNQYWAHVSPQGKQPWDFIKASGYQYLVAGENLARDFGHTNEMVEAWMASPTHRANIVNPKFREIGIAVINGTLNGFETTLVVQMFGSQPSQNPSVDKIAIVDDREEKIDSSVEISAQNTNETNSSDVSQLRKLDIRADKEFVLSESSNSGNLGKEKIIFSPLQASKVFFLLIIVIIVMTLIYDEFISGKIKMERLVGENIAHVLLFTTIIILLLLFKGGVV